MSVKENKAIVRRFIEEGLVNPNILDEIVADVYAENGQPQGLATLKQHVAKHLAGLPDWRFVIEDIIAEGDKVVACWRTSATHTGEWWGIPPTDREVEFAGVSCFRIADGKIAEQRMHWSGISPLVGIAR